MERNAWRTCAGVARAAAVVAVLTGAVVTGLGPAQAQERSPQEELKIEPRVVERGPHHRVVETVTRRVTSFGREYFVTNSYTELATGLHYADARGEWVESKEEIEIFNGAAVARQGQIQVIFAANLNSPGAIDLLAVDGQRFRSHVLGLVYTDYASGKSVMIAEIKDSIGELTAPNQVTYPDAFEGDCMADVRYTYTRAGFEQDIILRTAPPSPAEWGLEPETTRLEVFTEFIEAPAAQVTSVTLKREENELARQTMKEPDLIDQRLDFGGLHIGQGLAFPLGATPDPFDEASVPTGKSLERIDGRLVLIEKVDYPAVREQLGRLPKSASLNKQRTIGLPDPGRTMQARVLPSRPAGEPGRWTRKLQASVTPPRAGYVLDYVALSSSSITNYTFKSDTTYHVTGTVNLYGTTVLEGAVIKYNAAGALQVRGPLECRSTPYQPVIFTAKDDNTVGEVISGSTGAPSGYYGLSTMLRLYDTTTTYHLNDLRFAWSYFGIFLEGSVKANLSNLQVVKSRVALGQISGSSVTMRNFLFHDITVNGIAVSGTVTNRGEHGTIHRSISYRSLTNASPFTLTNSLLIAVTNNVVFQGEGVVTNLNDSGYFQTVGAGAHYLITGSTNRNAGTTNIHPDLLAALKKKTTHPPNVLTAFPVSTNLGAVVERDETQPDLGYHYEPLDYLVGGVAMTNVTVTLTNGAVLGIDASQTNYGLRLGSGASIIAEGNATHLVRVVRNSAVQEAPVGNMVVPTPLFADTVPVPANATAIRARFADLPNHSGAHLMNQEYANGTLTTLDIRDSRVRGGRLTLYPNSSNIVTSVTNTLLDRVTVYIQEYAPGKLHAFNNLFREGTNYFQNTVGGVWELRNNLFDQSGLYQYIFGTFHHSHNGYVNGFWRLTPTNANDQVLTGSPAYETNSHAAHYLPTSSSLINAGSTNAAALGLYHYTTTTNQVKETNSTVDIGLHFIALNGSGSPVDSDADGVPDHVEDPNGNGVTDGSENSFAHPVLTLSSTMTYIKGGPAKRFDTNAIAYDLDAANLNGGQFTVRITSGGEVNDRLGIRHEGTGAGQLGATTNTISYGGTNIATYTGGSGTNALVITFNTNAVNTGVQALARNLTFQSLSNAPASSNRNVSFTLTDGKGGTNAPTSLTIQFVCPDAIDAFVVIDISQSLSASEFTQAKEAASNFVNHLNFTTDRVGLVSFAGYANFDSPLTNNGALIQGMILSLDVTNGTRFHPAFDLARTNMTATASNTLPLMILLSDGRVGTASGSGTSQEKETNRVLALEAALAVKDAGIRMIAVAYGTNGGVDDGTNLMKAFASSANDFYYAPTIAYLNTNFAALAEGVCRGFSQVAITSPANNAVFTNPPSITLGASASDSEGVARVEFYQFGTNKLDEDASSPYSITWTAPTPGTNLLTAVAIDTLGIATTSAVVNVIVRSSPSVSIVSPTNATHFAAVMHLLVRAAATDVDGIITNVVFYTNGVKAVTVTNPPFRFPWTNLPGTNIDYRVHAVAWDNHGLTNTSATNTFMVDVCSQVGITNFTLSTNSVMGGSSVTATVTLMGNAPTGGQVLKLSANSPDASIPAAVLVPAGANQTTFPVDTLASEYGATVSLTVEAPGYSRSTNLVIEGIGFEGARYRGQCGPMDVAIALDINPNGSGSHTAITNGLRRLLENIEFASGGDYRLALVAFDATNRVKNTFAMTNRSDVWQSISQIEPQIAECNAGMYDEAINTIVNELPASGRDQVGDFNTPFRDHAQKLLVVISHTVPVHPGVGSMFSHETNIAYARVHARAAEAALKGIAIWTIATPYADSTGGGDQWFFWSPFGPGDGDESTAPALWIARDNARVTGGRHFKARPAEEAGNFHIALNAIVSSCGADSGGVITVRDDLHPGSHSTIALSGSSQAGLSLDPATFDLSGVDGRLAAAHLSRAGQLRVNFGSQFDLGLGVASFVDTNLQSYAPPTRTANLTALGSTYVTNWHLPFSFYSDIQGYLGGLYPLGLMDRVSSICGNSFEVIDTPQLDWPASKNTLTVKTLAPFEIAQGRCRDFVLTSSTNAPAGCDWEILLNDDDIVARSCDPKGWSVEADGSVFGGFNICVPAHAPTSKRYEVRVRDAHDATYAGYFEVLPAGAQVTAPVLLPLELSPRVAGTNALVTLTIALDAPASGNGAYVSLTTSNLAPGAIPAYVHIPAGESSSTVSFKASTNSLVYAITASYNGERAVAGKVVSTAATNAPVANVFVWAEAGWMDVTWDAHADAAYYVVEREASFDRIVVAAHHNGTCFIDTSVHSGTNYCYHISAVTPYGATDPEVASDCDTAINNVLRPRIEPHGGRFNDVAIVTLSCETTNATIRYTLDGTEPSDTNGADYSGPHLQIETNAHLVARAYIGAVWSGRSDADFHIAQPTPIECGVPITTRLATTNQPSVFKGSGHYGARYSFDGVRGDVVTLSVTSTNFDPDLNLTDPNKELVLQGGLPASLLNGFSPQLVHTLKTNGTYIVEVTSARQFETGDFTIRLSCTNSPELDVFLGTTNVVSDTSYDLGLVTTGATAQMTFRLTNSGSATLNFSSISITPAGRFTLNPASFTLLAAGAGTNLTVSFHATNTGPVTGTLTLVNDDEFDDTEGEYEFDDPFVITFNAFVNPGGVAPTITLVSPTNNHVATVPPAIAIDAVTTKTNSASITQVVFRATGPGGVTIIATGTATNVLWTNTAGGTYSLRAAVWDSDGRMALSAPKSLLVNHPPVAVDDAVELPMNSTNLLGVLGNDSDPNADAFVATNIVTQAARGTASVVDGVLKYAVTGTNYGRDSFRYAIADVYGARATGTVSVLVRPSGRFFTIYYTNTTEITNPPSHALLTGPTNVTGTASSLFLDTWRLDYRRRSEGPAVWTEIASATTNVVLGHLGMFDPTALPNGQYDLRVTLTDFFGNSQDSQTTVLVAENQKIGNFTLAFTDLQIPVSGLPITLTRTYDSRVMEVGDFGIGWNLDVNSVRLEKSGVMGEGWGGSAGTDSIGRAFAGIQETVTHTISIVFPDGKVYRFRPETWLNGTEKDWTGANYLSGAEASITYTNLPGTVGTLRELNPTRLLKVAYTAMDQPITLHDSRGTITEAEDDEGNGPPYDPKGFEFETLDGRKFRFNALGRVTNMVDRAGNSLTFRDDGVIHSSGRSVKFVRDAAGRITEIYDPNGLSQLSTNNSQLPVGPAALRYKYDSAGNLIHVHRLTTRSASDPKYVTTQFGYEHAKHPHYITSIVDPRGVTGIRNEYGEDGRLTATTDAVGNKTRFIHDLSNRVEIVINRLGVGTTNYYDTRGNVTAIVNALGQTNRMAYDADNRVIQTVDALGFTNSFGYDANGKRNAITNALGQVTRFGFNGYGQLSSKTDALSNTTSFEYSAQGSRTAVVDAMGHRTGFAHDGYGRPTAVTNALGQLRAQSGSDTNGSLQFVSEVGGLRMDFGHDGNLNTTNTSFGWVNPSNGQTQMLATATEFDAAGRITLVTDPDNQSRRTVYDEGGRVKESIGRMGETNSYVYDAKGNLIETTFPDGTVTRSVYDANDQVTHTVDRHLPGVTANGSRTIYDVLGRVVRAERLTGVQIDIVETGNVAASVLTVAGQVVSSSSTVYDAGGRVRFTTNAVGMVTETQYDPVGRQTAVIVAGTNRTDFVYDAAGRLRFTTNTLGHVTQHEYDAKGRKIKIILPDNSYTTNSYDEIGRLLAVRDVMGRVTDMEYDTRGRLKAVVLPQVLNPEGGTNARPRFEYEYDVYGNLTVIRDAKGRETKSTYDAFGQLVSRKLPLLQTNFHVYNALGQLAVAVDFKGQSNRMVYDSLGRVATNFFYAAGASVAGRTNVFEYEPGGRWQRFIRAEGTNEIDRNIDGAVTNILSAEGRITYEHDTAAGWLKRAFTTNSDVRYDYDGLGRLKTVAVHKRNGTNLPTPEVTTNTYTKLGSLQSVYFPNGTRTDYEYNRLNQLTNMAQYNGAGQLLARYVYTVASDGQRLAAVETRRESGGTYSTNWLSWSNDALRRLVREVSSSTVAALNYTNSYVHDLVGNRLWKTNVSGAGTVTLGYTYNTNDQLLVETSTAGGSFTNKYDANGSLTNRNSATETNWFVFDLEGRLTGATIHRIESGQSVLMTNRYFYNAAGIRVRTEMKRSVAGGAWVNETNVFLNDPQNLSGFSQVLEELATPGAVPGATYTLGAQVLSQEKAGAVSHLMADGLGSTRLLTDAIGAITNRFTFDAFGVPLDFTNSVVNPARTKILYGGEQHDAGLNQLYLRARYYHPPTARFGARDALDGQQTDPLTLHKYAYVQNNPVNMRDPSGNETIASVGIATSIGTTLQTLYNISVGTVGKMLQTESEEAVEALSHMENDPAKSDVASIIVHGISGFKLGGGVIQSYGWSENFRKDLSSPVGATVTRGVAGPELNHDFYEFNWGGFSIDIEAKGVPLASVGFVLVKSVHQMASVHLRIAQTTLYLKGYEKMNVLSHSWGTTLSYDLLTGGGIEMNHWASMGSPLNHDISKPVWNTGNWINAFSTRDPVTYLNMYPNSLIDWSPVFLPRFATSSFNPAGVDFWVNTTAGAGGMSLGEHGAYWTHPTLLTTLRTRLQ